MDLQRELMKLGSILDGTLAQDESIKAMYATDASPYREMPLAVVCPKGSSDVKKLVQFASSHGVSLIPRAAGTSLAGQVVGRGIVADVSVHMNKVLGFNVDEQWIKVEPGIVRDELNLFLEPYGLYFAPETSTSNRATIGGMVGNNGCGSNSISVGSTRDYLLEASVILSDATDAVFKSLNTDELLLKKAGENLEAEIYNMFDKLLSKKENQEAIKSGYPSNDVKRRNTGYALDALLECKPYASNGSDFNLCNILAGSEGTLAFITSIKVRLLPIPPPYRGVLCAHFNELREALQANLIVANFQPFVCELIDSYILDCTKDNLEQARNRFFVEGDPQAIMIIEQVANTKEEMVQHLDAMEEAMRSAGLGYHFPRLFDEDIRKVWSLRKAGLGLLSNMPGDTKPVTVIEDTAVPIANLESYIAEFDAILKRHGLSTVHYAHIGAGELHMRPMLNLKTSRDQLLFREIAAEIAGLVKKYKGALSGEHGDGRLRSQFIPQMIGEVAYTLLETVKRTWDPLNIFNPGKIVEAVPMGNMLRYEKDRNEPVFNTYFRFESQNILQHVEQCNGSGDCRKSHLMGGTMCPSFMATKNEKDTTRARANILREFLTHSEKMNRFDHAEIYEIMDLCLSCKGCKSECPSSVDMAKLKAEFLQQYYDVHGAPLRSRIIANISLFSQLGSLLPSVYNFIIRQPLFLKMMERVFGFAKERSLPPLSRVTLNNWYKYHWRKSTASFAKQNTRVIYFFCDEFTNFNDTSIGIKAIKLLEALGYKVIIPKHLESGRAAISKGLLHRAKKCAHQNIKLLAPLISTDSPLVGIEPSAILSFRDEYPDLVDEKWVSAAQALAGNTFTIEEFIYSEMSKGYISATSFTTRSRKIIFHGHCHQKAITDIRASISILSLPKNYDVKHIPSGCCGMAGSFGFEKEHYDLSMKIGELVLFPTVLNASSETIVAAPGTSCRHQIHDGTGRRAYHPIEILYEAHFERNNKEMGKSDIFSE